MQELKLSQVCEIHFYDTAYVAIVRRSESCTISSEYFESAHIIALTTAFHNRDKFESLQQNISISYNELEKTNKQCISLRQHIQRISFTQR